jgi:hypothetical protein
MANDDVPSARDCLNDERAPYKRYTAGLQCLRRLWLIDHELRRLTKSPLPALRWTSG